MEQLTIRSIAARAVITPLERQVRTASGTIGESPLVLLDVQTEEGIVGRAYLFGYTPMTLKPLVCLIEQLQPELIGKRVVPQDLLKALQDRYRLLGSQGLLGMVASGLDMAYWDALGKAADAPVVSLLGGAPKRLRAYDSYGMVEPAKDEKALRASLDQGFKAIKIKVGFADAKKDVDVVREVRDMIGPDIALMVDYNQSLTPNEAIRRIRTIEPYDLTWVEEPVAAEDLQGAARVRQAVNVDIQMGENWWFPRDAERALSANACDLMMPDVMKIGGITGWLDTMGMAQMQSMPMSSHIFVEASAHALAVSPTCHYLEYLDFAGAILAQKNEIVDGECVARGPGLGMEWDEAAVKRYAAR
jgi:mandelate racemase